MDPTTNKFIENNQLLTLYLRNKNESFLDKIEGFIEIFQESKKIDLQKIPEELFPFIVTYLPLEKLPTIGLVNQCFFKAVKQRIGSLPHRFLKEMGSSIINKIKLCPFHQNGLKVQGLRDFLFVMDHFGSHFKVLDFSHYLSQREIEKIDEVQLKKIFEKCRNVTSLNLFDINNLSDEENRSIASLFQTAKIYDKHRLMPMAICQSFHSHERSSRKKNMCLCNDPF